MAEDFQGNSTANPPQPEDPVWGCLQASLERLVHAGRHSTDPVTLAIRLATRARTLRGRSTSADSSESALMVVAFSKGTQRYAVPLDDVLEVQPLDHFTSVPKTPPFLPGVVHWRGGLLTLVDLGVLFGFPETGLADVHIYLVVEAAGRRIAIVGREVDEIDTVPISQVKAPPDLPGNIPPDWVVGVYDHNRLVVRIQAILQDSRLTDL